MGTSARQPMPSQRMVPAAELRPELGVAIGSMPASEARACHRHPSATARGPPAARTNSNIRMARRRRATIATIATAPIANATSQAHYQRRPPSFTTPRFIFR